MQPLQDQQAYWLVENIEHTDSSVLTLIILRFPYMYDDRHTSNSRKLETKPPHWCTLFGGHQCLKEIANMMFNNLTISLQQYNPYVMAIGINRQFDRFFKIGHFEKWSCTQLKGLLITVKDLLCFLSLFSCHRQRII